MSWWWAAQALALVAVRAVLTDGEGWKVSAKATTAPMSGPNALDRAATAPAIMAIGEGLNGGFRCHAGLRLPHRGQIGHQCPLEGLHGLSGTSFHRPAPCRQITIAAPCRPR